MFFNCVKNVIEKEIEKGNTKFIIFPYGETGMTARAILNGYHNVKYILVDNYKTGTEIRDFPTIFLNEYKDYKLLFCCISACYSELKEQLENSDLEGKIVDVYAQYFSDSCCGREMWGKISNAGFLDPRRGMLERCAKEIYHRGIAGNCAEAGVFQGEFAQHINYWFPDRTLYLADTFEGFPKEDIAMDKVRGFSDGCQDWSGTNIRKVLLKMPFKEQCIVKKGRFPDSMQDVNDRFAYVSLDMDLYQSILAGLEYFYPRLNAGGYIMVHDCCNEMYPGARTAVEEYCRKQKIGYVVCTDGCGTAVITK